MSDPRAERPYDVVLFGATGFTGRLVADYLAHKGPSGLRWALAGRSRAKLEQVRAGLGEAHRELPLLVADAHDRAALDTVARSTRVVCTTVGPFHRYGHELVAACAEHGTDYCDITGEVPFIRRTIDLHHERARAAGARLVPCCGFDSIPSDLGVLLLAERARTERGRPLGEVRFVALKSRGGFSGGTAASMMELVSEASRDRAARRLLGDPYGLSPDRARDLNVDGSDPKAPAFDPDLRCWTAPFLMGPINTRVVRRSNALTDFSYGKHFRYSEWMSTGRGPAGAAAAALLCGGLGAFMVAAAAPPTRRLLERLLPAPGEGPSKEQRDQGFFVIDLLGTVEGDASPSLRARVEGTSDPGYGETAKMLSESALCLALDPAPTERRGVLTPATALGARLIERLRAAGMTFSVQDF